MKFKDYDKWLKKPTEVIHITRKIDGVRVHMKDGMATSRRGHKLHNIPSMPDGIYEFYIDGEPFDLMSGIVRTHRSIEVQPEHLYELAPSIDPRLILTGNIDDLFEEQLRLGYEGLVLHCERVYVKRKQVLTYDIMVTGVHLGKGKYEGKVGALVTDMGNVGTGLTDLDRELKDWAGKLIEVGCMGLTKNGMFRHPRYIRRRWDKGEESK